MEYAAEKARGRNEIRTWEGFGGRGGVFWVDDLETSIRTPHQMLESALVQAYRRPSVPVTMIKREGITTPNKCGDATVFAGPGSFVCGRGDLASGVGIA